MPKATRSETIPVSLKNSRGAFHTTQPATSIRTYILAFEPSGRRFELCFARNRRRGDEHEQQCEFLHSAILPAYAEGDGREQLLGLTTKPA
jgi:hypothetical protein